MLSIHKQAVVATLFLTFSSVSAQTMSRFVSVSHCTPDQLSRWSKLDDAMTHPDTSENQILLALLNASAPEKQGLSVFELIRNMRPQECRRLFPITDLYNPQVDKLHYLLIAGPLETMVTITRSTTTDWRITNVDIQQVLLSFEED
jgi:hypothetical protein